MAQSIAFVTGADRGLGLAICQGLSAQGWRVFAGQYMPAWPALTSLAQQYPDQVFPIPIDVADLASVQAAALQVSQMVDRVDLLVNNAGVISSATNERKIRDGQDYEEIRRVFEVNALGPIRVVESFLSLVELSQLNRLCFVSSEAGSIGKSYRTAWYGYDMSKASLNMAVKTMFNELRPQGFTFRLYHPGWIRSYMSGTKNTAAALEPEEAAAYALAYFLGEVEDENTLVLRDYQGHVWPW